MDINMESTEEQNKELEIAKVIVDGFLSFIRPIMIDYLLDRYKDELTKASDSNRF